MDGLSGVATGSGVGGAVGAGVGEGEAGGGGAAAGAEAALELRHVEQTEISAHTDAARKSVFFINASSSYALAEHFPCRIRYGATDQ